MSNPCAACAFASVMVEGEAIKVPEKERYAFAFATGAGHALATARDVTLILCAEHAKDAATCAGGLLDQVVAQLADKRSTGKA